MEEFEDPNDDLPEGWRFALLGDICGHPQYGWTTSADPNGRGTKFLRTTDISKGEVDWSTVPGCEREPEDVRKYLLSPGDILVSRAGSVGLSYVVKECPRAVFASYLIRFKPTPPIPSDYIGYFLKSPKFWDAIDEETAGIAIPNVNASKLKKLKIPLAPVEEQKRIVARLEEVLPKVNAVRERLIRVKEIMKRFRQSILSAACSGRLTEDWREKNPKFTPVSSLLQEIKKAHHGQKQSEKSRNSVKKFAMNEPEEGLEAIPESWKWVALGNYAECERGRFSVRPRNDPRYYDGKYPFIQIGDLPPEGGRVKAHKQTLNDQGLAISKPFPRGTVAVAIVGATIGNTGILDYEMCFPDSLVGVQTGFETGNRFLEYYFRFQKEKMRSISYASGGQPNIKLETLNAYPYPLASREEQCEIVCRIDALFKLADKIEKRVEVELSKIEKMTQAILAKAFRGELVPPKTEMESNQVSACIKHLVSHGNKDTEDRVK